MFKRTVLLPLAAASLLVPSLWTAARADGTQTTQAGTVVVVTQSSPVVVSAAPGQTAPAPVAPPVQPPGATEMPPAPLPPQNQDWHDVSNINGQIVPVGEHNRYLYTYRKNNIMVNPFGPFLGYYDASFSHGVSQNVAISLSVSGWNHVFDENGFQVAASAPIYFRRTFSGPFLEPGLVFHTTTRNDTVDYGACIGCAEDVMPSSSDSWAGPELLFGWHWMFDSGLNVVVASGMAKRMDRNDGDDGVEFNGYFRAGYAF